MIVMKFGGTSVEDAAALQRAAKIIADSLERCILVVLSAMGGTTDRLLRCAQLAANGHLHEARELLYQLREHHEREARKCIDCFSDSPVAATLAKYFTDLENLLEALSVLGENSPRSQDAVSSYGERLSTLLFSRLLEQQGVRATLTDSRQLIRTDTEFTRAAPDFTVPAKNLPDFLPQLYQQGQVPILLGFIGSDEN